MPKELTGIAAGVDQAFGYWLYDHETPDCIMLAVEKATSKWLDAHTDEIIAAIAAGKSKNDD